MPNDYSKLDNILFNKAEPTAQKIEVTNKENEQAKLPPPPAPTTAAAGAQSGEGVGAGVGGRTANLGLTQGSDLLLYRLENSVLI